MPKFKNWFNADEFPPDHEVIDQPSLTVPDQSLAVSEILNRFANGQHLGGQPWDGFDEDADVPEDFQDLSKIVEPAERARLQKEYQDELIMLNQKIKADAEEKRRAAQRASTLQKLKEKKEQSRRDQRSNKNDNSGSFNDSTELGSSTESDNE